MLLYKKQEFFSYFYAESPFPLKNQGYRQILTGFPGGLEVKASASNARDLGSIPGLGRTPGEWLPTPVFLPGEFYGQTVKLQSQT